VNLLASQTNSAKNDGMAALPPRLPDETAKAYFIFCRWVNFGSTRTFGRVAAEFGKSRDAYEKMARRWRWQERVQAFDAAMAEEDAAAFREAHRLARDARLRREMQRQNACWELAERVKARLAELLQVPVTESERDDGTVRPINAALLPGIAALTRSYMQLTAAAVENLTARETASNQEARAEATTVVAGCFRLWAGENGAGGNDARFSPEPNGVSDGVPRLAAFDGAAQRAA
jgi:hypothetical protein